MSEEKIYLQNQFHTLSSAGDRVLHRRKSKKNNFGDTKISTMVKTARPSYFTKQPQFQLKPDTILLFIVLSVAAWCLLVLGYSIFPTQSLVPYAVRTILTFLVDLVMLYTSFWLLKRNNLPRTALGLVADRKTIADLLIGLVISFLMIAIMTVLLYAFVPFHFGNGSLNGRQVLAESISYLAGNTLEELMFRGFLFIVLSRLLGWRTGLIIMAALFGIFHLQGMHWNTDGLKMVISTACFGAVFGLSFIFSRSLWTPITVHVISNILLHAITGLDGNGKALLKPVFEKKFPGYDIGFFIGVSSAVIVLIALLFIVRRREKGKL